MSRMNITGIDIRSEEGRSQPKTGSRVYGASPLALKLIPATNITILMTLCTSGDYHSVNEFNSSSASLLRAALAVQCDASELVTDLRGCDNGLDAGS
jgi:hypothetical protein